MPVYKRVDTCAAEFESFTPYLYSTYEEEDEAAPTDKKKVIILGSGPNRIGQGIEFDYCCCHASFALRDDGYETIMVNCNPETVSTDYDTSDRLYFEPLTFEDVLAIYEHETRKAQSRRDRAVRRADSAEPRAAAESGGREDHRHIAGVDRPGGRPQAVRQAAGRTARSRRPRARWPQSSKRPSQAPSDRLSRAGAAVLRAGRARHGDRLRRGQRSSDYMQEAVEYSQDRPVLIDHFLEDAIEVDVDALSDGEDVVIGGIMQHIEEAGIHSGDSSCVLPAVDIPQHLLERMREYTFKLARALKVVGLMNIQFAIPREGGTGNGPRAARFTCSK